MAGRFDAPVSLAPRTWVRRARSWILESLATATVGCAACVAACESRPSDVERSTGGLRVVADEQGFSPRSLPLPKGGPGSTASVTFVRTTDKTCATEVVFPDLKVTKSLPLHQSVAIDVPTDTARTLTFQCGMGMYRGAVVVR
ncbi:MAG: cupredoxin domain-containing protein [Polyangiaceae bacterium]